MKTILTISILALGGLGHFTVLASEDGLTKPMLFDGTNGWRQKVTDKESIVLHTDDDGKHWLNVSPPSLNSAVRNLWREDGYAALCPLDGQRTWVSITPMNMNVVLLEYTADAGKHWKERVAYIKTNRARISFVDELHGYLLATSGPSAGSMDKKVYGTVDGGQHWQELTAPPALSCYPTGISFRSHLEGWITATNHGGDYAPLYRTDDGGKSWKLQKLEIPEDYRGMGCVDTYPPVFIHTDKKKGYLPVKLVGSSQVAWANYETEDGGKTWHLPTSNIWPVLSTQTQAHPASL